jgi:hypothetical protein
MPQLTFPISARELIADVRVNVSAADMAQLYANRRAAPSPVVARGELDTGSNVTGVSAAVIQRLALVPHGRSSTTGIGGNVTVQLYRVSLSVFDPANPLVPWFVVPDLEVMELPPSVRSDVLIGMDVLLECRLFLDGPARTFTLDY